MNFISTLKHIIFLLMALIISYITAQLTVLTIPLTLAIIFLAIVSLKIFQNPTTGIILIAFFLPFERIGSYDIGGVTIRISQILALITIIAWLIQGLINKKIKITKNPIIIPLLFFIIINLISLINTPNLPRSLMVLAFTIFTIIFSLTIPNLIKDKGLLKKVVWALLLGCLVTTIFGIYQFVGDMSGLPATLTGLRSQYTKVILGFTRVQSTTLEPLYFANYLLIPLAVALALFLTKGKYIKKGYLIIILILGIINLILTASRGGYLAFIATALIILIFYWRALFSWKKILTGIVVIFLILFVLPKFLNLAPATQPFQSNFTALTQHAKNLFSGAAYEERVERYEQALTVWRNHPWIGNGPGSFGPTITKHPLQKPTIGWAIVNNEPMELLVETGILGLASIVLLVIILISATWIVIRHARDNYLRAIAVALLAAFIGIIIQYQTFSVLYIMHIWFLIGIIVAVNNIINKKQEFVK